MRRALAVLISAVAALSIVTAAPAAPRHERAVAARAALERAATIFETGSRDPRGATPALRELAARLGDLGPEDRRAARALLSRPTDSGSSAQHFAVPTRYFRKRCLTDFCVHWTVRGTHAPSLRDRNPQNGRPDWIDKVIASTKVVWNEEVVQFGYRPPRNDGTSGGHRGGNPNGKIDIFVANVGALGIYGYCTTDDPRLAIRNDVSAYCVVDDDFSRNQFPTGASGFAALKVTLAHEFHHAVQFAYDYFEDLWFMEATATNMEADVYPSIRDNYQYFASSPVSKTTPWRPIDRWTSNGTNQYGSWIFFRFLAEYFTGSVHPITSAPDTSFVQGIWERAAAVPGTIDGGLYSTEAIEHALGDESETFPSIFRQFGVANAAPAAWYKDGALFNTRAAQSYPSNTLDAGSVYDADLGMAHMTNDYWVLRPGSGTTTLDVDVDFPGSVTSPRATILVFTGGALVDEEELALDANGNGSLPGAKDFDSSVGRVVIVVTNASTRFTNCFTDNRSPIFSCSGTPLDDSGPNAYKLDLLVP